MKTRFLALLVLVFALSTKPLHCGAAAAAAATPKANASASANANANAASQQVVDTSGKKLRVGLNYYIVPAPFWEQSGGVALASTGEDCPLLIVAVDGYQGQPLTFTPVNPKKGVVRVDTDLNIAFSTETSCHESTVWKLGDYDDSTEQYFVTTGGVIGNPGWQTVSNWFKIEQFGDYYRLMYCPSVCKYCTVQCRDIGIYVDDNGNKRLALSDSPYVVQFQQA